MCRDWPYVGSFMYWTSVRLFLAIAFMTSVFVTAKGQTGEAGLREFQQRAAKYNSVITLPQFETTTNEVEATLRQTITNGNAALDKIGGLQPKQVNFKNKRELPRTRPRSLRRQTRILPCAPQLRTR